MALQATIDFRLKVAADPASPPTGWALGTGSLASKYFNRGEIGWEATAVQSLWYNTTAMQGNIIESEVTAGLAISVSIGAAIVDASGNGYMAINNNTASALRIFLVVASQLSGTALVTVNLPMVVGQRIMLRRTITPSNTYEILIDGVSRGSYNAPATYDPTYGACVSRLGSIRQVDLYYTPSQTVTSINGGNPITAGQTGIAIEATGFSAKPTAVTAIYASGAKSITATIDSGGTATNFNISIQDRIEAEDWPVNGDTITFTITYLSESATGTQTLVKKASETVLTVSGGITIDPATWTYWLTQDGFTVEGGEHDYIPYGDLVLTADGGGSATNAGTFTSWFRPATGTGAGNVYAYTWVITEAGISPAGSGLTSSGLTVSGLTSAGLTSSGL